MKKSIFKRIGLIALAVCVAIGSFFVPLKSDKKLNSAHADSSSYIYTFDGSNIYLPILRQDGNQFVDYLLFGMNFTINKHDSTVILDFDNSSGYWSANRQDGSLNWALLILNADQSGSLPFDYIFTGLSSGSCFVWNVPYYSWISSSNFGMAVVGSSLVPDEIIGVELGFINTSFSNFSYSCNYVKYFDSSSNHITFYLRSIDNNAVNNFYETRTYYFNNALDLDDNQIFNQGYQQGLSDNQQNVYDNGYNAGYNIGFGQGRQDGIVEANDYSFISLISAVVDVPVKTFFGLFEFEFLGVNLSDFLLGLLTFSVIIFVIKLLVGGK